MPRQEGNQKEPASNFDLFRQLNGLFKATLQPLPKCLKYLLRLPSRRQQPLASSVLRASSADMDLEMADTDDFFIDNNTSRDAAVNEGTSEFTESAFTKDYYCCGLVLADLHALLDHYEDGHVHSLNDLHRFAGKRPDSNKFILPDSRASLAA
jgi:hypothetical protein